MNCVRRRFELHRRPLNDARQKVNVRPVTAPPFWLSPLNDGPRRLPSILVAAAELKVGQGLLSSPLSPTQRRAAALSSNTHTHTHITICAHTYILLCYPCVDIFIHERRERLNRRPFSPAFAGARGLISAWEFHSSLRRRSDGTDRMCSPVRASSSVCSWEKRNMLEITRKCRSF